MKPFLFPQLSTWLTEPPLQWREPVGQSRISCPDSYTVWFLLLPAQMWSDTAERVDSMWEAEQL